MLESNIEHAYIAVTGNIASGKTNLIKHMENLWPIMIFKEEVDVAVLDRFYADRKEHGYQTQVSFITSRAHDLAKIKLLGRACATDYWFGVDSQVYAKNLLLEGNLTSSQYAHLVNLEQSLMPYVREPDLLIYLRTSVDVLKQRIIKRAEKEKKRENELELAKPGNDYLRKLEELHEDSFLNYQGRKAVITTDNLSLVPDRHFGLPKKTEVAETLMFIHQCVDSSRDGERCRFPEGKHAPAAPQPAEFRPLSVSEEGK